MDWKLPRPWTTRPIVLFLAVLLVFEVLAAESITSNSIVVDEFAHLPAGVAYWQDGLFSMYDENPPLAKYLVSVPACLLGAKMDYSKVGREPRWEWGVGQDFRQVNRQDYLKMFSWGRFVTVALSVLCGAIIFRWTGLLYGTVAALVCSTLWFLDPNVLAHSTVATTDVATTAFGLLATYWFWQLLRQPSWMKTVLSGLGLGLALGTKFSMIVLVPIWIAMALLVGQPSLKSSSRWVGRAFARLVIISVLALLVVNILYGFRGTGTALGSLIFTSPLLSGQPHTTYGDLLGNRFDGTWLGMVRVPLPRDYLLGFDSQLQDQQDGRFANLSDGHLIVGGFWYSPLKTLLFKSPSGSLLLIGASFIYWAQNARRIRVLEGVIWIVPFVIIGLFCVLGGGLNFAYRYTMPGLPYLLIVAGKVVQGAWKYRLGKVAILSCLLWNSVSLIAARPSYLCFGNDLSGGCSGAQRMFLGSNYDWGQDLFRLKAWSDEHPECRPLSVAYFGPIGPAEVGIKTSRPPRSFYRDPGESLREGPAQEFYWAVSSSALYGLRCFIAGDDGLGNDGIILSARLRPESSMCRVGGSIYVFHIGPRGIQSMSGVIAAEDLEGCIHGITAEDVIATP